MSKLYAEKKKNEQRGDDYHRRYCLRQASERLFRGDEFDHLENRSGLTEHYGCRWEHFRNDIAHAILSHDQVPQDGPGFWTEFKHKTPDEKRIDQIYRDARNPQNLGPDRYRAQGIDEYHKEAYPKMWKLIHKSYDQGRRITRDPSKW